LGEAVNHRTKILDRTDTQTNDILKEVRKEAAKQRKQIRIFDRRREQRERTKGLEELARRQESRLQDKLSDQQKTKVMKSFMIALSQRQDKFLQNISENMREWAKRQRELSRGQMKNLIKLNSQLKKRIKGLEKRIQDLFDNSPRLVPRIEPRLVPRIDPRLNPYQQYPRITPYPRSYPNYLPYPTYSQNDYGMDFEDEFY